MLNILGSEVATIVNGEHVPGSYTARWRGLDRDGLPIASGIYFYRLDVGGSVAVKKMMILR